MALFPSVGRLAGDFVPHFVVLDTEDTMEMPADSYSDCLGRRPHRRGAIVTPLAWLDVRFRE